MNENTKWDLSGNETSEKAKRPRFETKEEVAQAIENLKTEYVKDGGLRSLLARIAPVFTPLEEIGPCGIEMELEKCTTEEIEQFCLNLFIWAILKEVPEQGEKGHDFQQLTTRCLWVLDARYAGEIRDWLPHESNWSLDDWNDLVNEQRRVWQLGVSTTGVLKNPCKCLAGTVLFPPPSTNPMGVFDALTCVSWMTGVEPHVTMFTSHYLEGLAANGHLDLRDWGFDDNSWPYVKKDSE